MLLSYFMLFLFVRFFFFVALGGPGRRRFRAFHPLRSVVRERGGEDCRAAVRRGAVSPLLKLLASLLLLERETIFNKKCIMIIEI